MIKPSPMLATKGSIEHFTGSKLDLTAQPKLNGIRATWDCESQAFFTRNGLEIKSVDHIVSEIEANPILKSLPLDGEIYSDSLTFQEINGLSRRNTTSEITEKLCFHIFDIANKNLVSRDRMAIISIIKETKNIKKVLTVHVSNEVEINRFYTQCLNDGFEGIIIRNPSSRYEHCRTNNLIKIKPQFESEAILKGFTDAEDGSRNSKTFGSLVLEWKGITFHCSGLTDKERSFIFNANPIGERITFIYGALSNTGIPIFPRYKCIRWDA